ncbi:NAD(P)-dependent dehydrogenase (short-subunit alcohol dehydrogenase family) [Actinomadura coerulea]|uniref:NAD(P)-dependent dehydrogenase (Short-subunit alcohol dehydrogenase family) n=1 Tax=Actinomadura coerulea TaxID=46159 RepID=A0A7X0G160_9ACTN|nr:SDR family oxidoreductase [Actinomadura coerulea]MBB6397505.1 NAD(P)-dependent dehydrogenase (short-subunit alcohol dehydrogenase family) [Actinomadura coerulea]GGQ03087.1 3-ketoacyl-ACP reductase [Actinomadura coerulea]
MRTGLEGRTALVTGASRGIGKAIATAFAAEGANVVLSSRKQEALDEVAAEIRAAHPGAGVLAKAAHVGDAEQAAACVDAAVAEFGGLDILVNNAGTNPYFGPMADIEPAAAAKTVQVNQFAIVQWTQLALRASLAERGGAIINIASVGGMVTEHGIGYYNATKAAVIHLSRQFAMELAPKVRVNCIAPGLVKTHLARALWENNEAEIGKYMPLGRIGEPEDIANAAVFLAGDASSWMTGQTLVVDGGATIRPSIA